jgi:hypothetical protein
MDRKTRKTTPEDALKRTSGISPQDREAMRGLMTRPQSTVLGSQRDAKDQWGIGRDNANSFREDMRRYDHNRRNPDLEDERSNPPSRRRIKERSF